MEYLNKIISKAYGIAHILSADSKKGNEISLLKNQRDEELGFIIKGKRIPTKSNIYKESIIDGILQKAVVLDNKIEFHFNKGIVIEKEFSNSLPGRRKKQIN